jgi:hypothetical protein
MEPSYWMKSSFVQQVIEWRQRFGEEAAAVRHELFFLAAGRARLSAGLRGFGALLRDVRLLLTSSQSLTNSPKPQAILLTTLQGASGWATLERSLRAVAAAGYQPIVLAHPRLSSDLFPPGLSVVRPAKVDAATLAATLRVLVVNLIRSRPLVLASCLARRRLWEGSLRRTLTGSRGVLLLHNDFDMMSRSAIGLGLPAVCLQHGVPTDEFFPTNADWYLTWGGSSRSAFEAADSRSSQLIDDALGLETRASQPLIAPDGLCLLSQTHAQVLGEGIESALHDFADALLKSAPQARILLHPQEGQPYAGSLAMATRRPPHPELKPEARGSSLVMGYCSTAMLEAAFAGHWVVALQLRLDGNLPARSILAAPLRAETAYQAVALYHRLIGDADFRREAAEAQRQWLRDSFSTRPGGLQQLLQNIDVRSSGERRQ